MKAISAQFIGSAVSPDRYPASHLPEIAFLGRSNVGKSSLINSLLRQKGLARTSNTPGRTQQINFFRVEDEFLFVDLPGYGFAQVPREVRQAWAPMIEHYLNHRSHLALGILIVDMRHAPQPLDCQMHAWLEAKQLSYCVVATKADKLSQNQLARQMTVLRAAFGANVLPYSAVTRKGSDEVWRIIRQCTEARF